MSHALVFAALILFDSPLGNEEPREAEPRWIRLFFPISSRFFSVLARRFPASFSPVPICVIGVALNHRELKMPRLLQSGGGDETVPRRNEKKTPPSSSFRGFSFN